MDFFCLSRYCRGKGEGAKRGPRAPFRVATVPRPFLAAIPRPFPCPSPPFRRWRRCPSALRTGAARGPLRTSPLHAKRRVGHCLRVWRAPWLTSPRGDTWGRGVPLPRGLPFTFCPCANLKGRGAPLRVWACPPVHLPLWQVHGGWGVPLPRGLRSRVDPTCEPGKGGCHSRFRRAPGSLVCWARRRGGAPSLPRAPPLVRVLCRRANRGG